MTDDKKKPVYDTNKTFKSSFDGRISEIPFISVDNFQYVARAYFLTHHHMDHIVGLYTNSLCKVLAMTESVIYCTELTAAVIEHNCRLKGITELIKFVRGLKYGSTLITLPTFMNKSGDEIPELLITVTLIPAGHCLGSTMFLFKTPTITVLFTGDFRIDVNDVSKYEALHCNGEPIKIDTMYIDTTFLDFKYKDYPKRSDSIDVLIQEISKFFKRYGRGAISLSTSATYGYEYAFNEIYRRLGIKVYVEDSRWDFYNTIQHLVPGVTNNDNEDRLHLCRYNDITKGHPCIKNKYKYFLHIHLSAMKWANYGIGDRPIINLMQEHIYVCFATHCSAQEIMYFKNYFNPGKVIGFPNVYKEIDFSNDDLKLRQDKKLNTNLLKLLFGL